MTAWIFQGNPDRFDIDGYLAFAPDRITWLVNQYRKDVRLGDQVFLWRARGSGAAGPAGIVAECLVVSPVMEMEDEPSSIQFWQGSGETRPRPRVWLKVLRVAATLLERDVIANTLALEAAGPIGFGNATNFKLSDDQSRELTRIWHDRTIARTEEQARAELDKRATALEQSPIDHLLNQYRQRVGARKSLPRRSQAIAFVFERDPFVAQYREFERDSAANFQGARPRYS
jgi:plasmid stabilization system protein ParE